MYHGALSVGHKLYSLLKLKLGISRIDAWLPYRAAAVLVFFHLVCIGWVFFRIKGLGHAVSMLERMLNPRFLEPTSGLYGFFLAIIGLALLHPLEYGLVRHAGRIGSAWRRFVPSPVRAVCYVALAAVMIVFFKTETNAFIYFQF